MFLRKMPLDETVELDSQDDICLDCAGLTHAGRVRKTNQDQFLIADLHKNLKVQSSSVRFLESDLLSGDMGKLLLVADGMGGANAGDVASQLAIRSTVQFLLNSMHWLFHPEKPDIDQFLRDLKSTALFSHDQVRQDANSDPNRRGMGTTLTAAFVVWPMLYVLHVGDSRCYVMHNDELQLLTKDQTLAQHLYEKGHLTTEDFKHSPYNHVLVSAIGIEGEPDVVVNQKRIAINDRILLCSDGVNRHIDDAEIGEILRTPTDSQHVCEQIVAIANQRGGHDNITVLTARVRN